MNPLDIENDKLLALLKGQKNELDHWINSWGIRDLLWTLSLVCDEKANQAFKNSKDELIIKAWEKMSKDIKKLRSNINPTLD